MVNIVQEFVNDEQGSVAEVTIGEEVIEVRYWYSYTNQFSTNDEKEAFLTALAYEKLNNKQQAIITLTQYANGELIVTEQESEINGQTITQKFNQDTRNWAKVLIDFYNN